MSSIYKTLGLVFIGVLLAGFLIWRWVQKSKEFAPIEPTNVFKSIEYVEELHLSTYFFEELLVLGTPEKVKQLVENLQQEVEELSNEVRKKTFFVSQAQAALSKLDDELANNNPDLSSKQAQLQVAKDLYDAINKRKSKIIKLLAKNDSLFGGTVQQAYRTFKSTQERLDALPSRNLSPAQTRLKAQLEASIGTFKSLLEKAIEDESTLRWKTQEKIKGEVSRLQKAENKDQKDLEKNQKEAEKRLSKAQNALKKAQKTLTEKTEELERAEEELAWAKQTGEDTLKPKLMIIAETQLSSYVDLKELKVNQRPFDDTLLVYVPKPQLDSVIVKIDDDSTKLYQLARAERENVSNDGAYYDIFQQLKNEIIAAEARVKKRAIEAGIIEETKKLAKEYVLQFAGNLNLPVIFVDSATAYATLPPLPSMPQSEQDEDTSVLPAAVLDTLQTLDSSAIEERKESLNDSSLLELQNPQP